MGDFINTTGVVLARQSERLYDVRTPIGKVILGFIETRDGTIDLEDGQTVNLQFQFEDLSRARILPPKTNDVLGSEI